MGLRSMALLVTLAVVSAMLLAGMLWLWPWLGRRRLAAVAARVVLLGVLQVTVLGFVFVWVNRSLEFYSSWSDLLGTNSLSGSVVSFQAGLPTLGQQAPAVTVLDTRTVPVAGAPRAAVGHLQTVLIRGALSGVTAPGFVYLPPGYSESSPRLPVAVVLSDEATRPTAVYGARRIADTAAEQILAHHLPPTIVVVLDGTLARDGCLNVPGGPQLTMFFTQDLTRTLERAYRAATTPARWAVVGGPGGGYCALQLATLASDPFAVAVAPPGSYTAPPGGGVIPSGATPTSGTATVATQVHRASLALREQDSVLWRLRHWPPPPVHVLLAGPGSAAPLLTAVRPPLRVSTTGLASGPWPLSPVFAWIGRELRSPA